MSTTVSPASGSTDSVSTTLSLCAAVSSVVSVPTVSFSAPPHAAIDNNIDASSSTAIVFFAFINPCTFLRFYDNYFCSYSKFTAIVCIV